MSFAIDRAIFGPGPFGVHLMNVLANAAAAVLAYSLVMRLLRRRAVALIAGLLFAIHPIHTEVVANGAGRAELYSIVALLAALHLHLTYVRRSVERRARDRRMLHLAGAALLYLVALLLKESAVVLPGLLLLMDWLVVEKGRLRAVLPRLGAYALYVLPLGVYLIARLSVVGAGTPAVQEVMAGASGLQRVLFAGETILRYLGQLVVPWRLCAEYADYEHLISPSFADPLVLAALAAGVGGVVLVVWLFRRKQYLLLLAIGWFVLTLLPVSNLIVPIGTVRADRLLFLPSLGFVLAAAYLLAELTGRQKVAGIGLMVVLLGFYGTRTALRNQEWRSQDTLWTATVRDNPGSAMGWLMVGNIRRDQGAFEQAESAYERAWQLRDGAGFFYADAHANHAALLKRRGEQEEAAGHYRLVLEHDPDNRPAMIDLAGMLYREAATRREAINLLTRAIELAPDEFRVYVNLAQVYRLDGQLDQALKTIDQAIALQPSEPRLRELRNAILQAGGR